MQIKKAVKQQLKLRLALTGPSGSGKTYTALTLATAMGGQIGVIDTERSSASRYADEFEFDVIELSHYSPDSYVQAIREFDRAGYDVLIIDSLSHAWMGEGGVLDIAGGKFSGWKDATPAHNALVSAILNSRMHVIVTMRSKTEYAVEVDDKTKKQNIKKIGTAPIQKDGVEYEMDIVGDLDWSHTMTINKTRCRAIDGKVFRNPDATFMDIVKTWLNTGEESTADLIRQLQAERKAARDRGATLPPMTADDAAAMTVPQLRAAIEETKGLKAAA